MRKNHREHLFHKSMYIAIIATVLVASCKPGTSIKEKLSSVDPAIDYVSYADDISFMKNYTDIITIAGPTDQAKIALAPALQGRVMTSSANGEKGRSYGWINRELFKSRDTLEHINVFGGEERFWIGPEGGQFSIFFKEGSEFNLDDWYTPPLIDLEPFEIKEKTSSSVMFSKTASLVNYSGFQFDFDIERKVEVLSVEETFKALDIAPMNDVKAVAYQTTNSLINKGEKDWQKETGLLSIWLLGMFNPSPSTTVVIPFRPGTDKDLGIPVNDTYFGKVPIERLVVNDSILYFSGDGEYRSKIGLSPKRAKNILGSYDSTNKILTIVKYNQPEGVTDYVNSMWELQDEPYAGDVVNSYNDGVPAPGEKPLGPFYELETSSPALALKVGESGEHIQLTCHFEGDEEVLDQVAIQLLGVSIENIKTVFN